MKLLMILAIAIGAVMAAGYRLHPENLTYYLKVEPQAEKFELKLKAGDVWTVSIEEETDSGYRINADGAILSIAKNEIESLKPVGGGNLLEELKKNYEKNKKKYPLLTLDKQKSLKTAWDNFVMEPSRLAEEIKKKNPGISMTDQLNQAMAAAAQARQQQAKLQAEMERQGG